MVEGYCCVETANVESTGEVVFGLQKSASSTSGPRRSLRWLVSTKTQHGTQESEG